MDPGIPVSAPTYVTHDLPRMGTVSSPPFRSFMAPAAAPPPLSLVPKKEFLKVRHGCRETPQLCLPPETLVITGRSKEIGILMGAHYSIVGHFHQAFRGIGVKIITINRSNVPEGQGGVIVLGESERITKEAIRWVMNHFRQKSKSSWGAGSLVFAKLIDFIKTREYSEIPRYPTVCGRLCFSLNFDSSLEDALTRPLVTAPPPTDRDPVSRALCSMGLPLWAPTSFFIDNSNLRCGVLNHMKGYPGIDERFRILYTEFISLITANVDTLHMVVCGSSKAPIGTALTDDPIGGIWSRFLNHVDLRVKEHPEQVLIYVEHCLEGSIETHVDSQLKDALGTILSMGIPPSCRPNTVFYARGPPPVKSPEAVVLITGDSRVSEHDPRSFIDMAEWIITTGRRIVVVGTIATLSGRWYEFARRYPGYAVVLDITRYIPLFTKVRRPDFKEIGAGTKRPRYH